jgi:hypothetical protein
MNALTFGFKTQPLPGRRVVSAARAFAGHPYISAPGRARCFDCVALITALTGYDIPPGWVRSGGNLPFAPIPLEAALPGDLLVLKDQDHWLMAVMTEGSGLDDPRARLFTVRRCRAAAEMWLTPALKDALVSAYRLPVEG